MKFVVFSKSFSKLTIPELAAALKEIGVSGVDLAVREGHPVNPGNVRKALPEAVKLLKNEGLTIGLVSAATNVTDPHSRVAEDIWAACHDANVPIVKIGYFDYKQGKGYWPQVDAARKQLDGFKSLAMRFGVKAALHTHSGANLGNTSASLAHLLMASPVSQLCAYLDPGHLSLNGEPLPMAMDMVSEHLECLAFKDAIWKMEKGKRASHFVSIGEGMVDWKEVTGILGSRRFSGPISLHSEYGDKSVEELIRLTKQDLRFLTDLRPDRGRA